VGTGAYAGGYFSSAVGTGASAGGYFSFAVGPSAYAAGDSSLAMGYYAYSPNANEINFATNDSTYGIWNANGGYTQLDISDGVATFANNRVLIGNPTDDTTSALQVAGASSLDTGEITTDGSGSLTANLFNPAVSQVTVNGLTGTAVWSMPFQGTSYKKVVMYLTNFTSAGTVITFPTAFTNVPYVTGGQAGIAVTTTTTMTLTRVGAVGGWIFAEGY
jgi:hypothetical protein